MTTHTNEFDATVAHFKAIADEKLARLRGSPQFDSFLTQEAVAAFSRVETSAYAGRSLKQHKRPLS
ncbi:hypothetical protein [Pseudomonas sp. UFMG81]|jgi:hypothetical protein|uniref:hypothetical protein n=1 Tax=Pseudomonas sp. UFMG81 TaxID=2745936 RepID=UPI0018907401|nr:hypothetical protein [Pseudomonas sp. UFMG81]